MLHLCQYVCSLFLWELIKDSQETTPFLVLAEKVILLLHVLQALVSLMSVIKERHSISCSFLNQFLRCFVSLYVFGIRVVTLGLTDLSKMSSECLELHSRGRMAIPFCPSVYYKNQLFWNMLYI